MSDPTTIRDALEAAVPSPDPTPAFEQSAAESAPEPVAEAVAQAVDTAEAPATGSRERDKSGRFKPADAKAEPVAKPQQSVADATPTIQPGPKVEPRQSAPQERAPASWRPEVREHWAQLPETVRAEVARRERETQQALAESTEARRFTEQLQNVIRPYEMFIKAENSNPLQAIDNLMSTAARLRTGTAPELATMVAGIVRQFGVGRFGNAFIEQLDSALAGEMPRGDAASAQVQQILQQQLAPVQQFMTQLQQQQAVQAQRAQQEATSEVQRFITQAEFGEDVREEMADLMEVAQRRGRELTLQDAYRQACLVNPRVRSVLESRSKAQGAQAASGAAAAARAKAVSVTGAAAPAGPAPTPTDVRSAIEAALVQSAR